MKRLALGALRAVACAAGFGCAVLGTAGAQTITQFPYSPNAQSLPQYITRGPDGALWFAEGRSKKIGRMTTTGQYTGFPLPAGKSEPQSIVLGSDGAFWYSRTGDPFQFVKSKIGRMTTAGAVTEYDMNFSERSLLLAAGPDGAIWFVGPDETTVGRITTAGAVTMFPFPLNSRPVAIAVGPDGNLWITEFDDNKIARMKTDGTFVEFPIPTADAGAVGITQGSDGAMWFSERNADKIGRITTAGVVTEYPLPIPNGGPEDITMGPDGNMWFIEGQGNAVSRVTTAGVITEYGIPTPASVPLGITAGPDGALWFTEGTQDAIGRFRIVAGTSPLLSAVLPTSRSVQTGNVATVFASMINSGTSDLTNCKIAPVTPLTGTFLYQTTDPATNKLTGTANTPALIPRGGLQTFLIAITANGPLPPADALLGYSCNGVPPAVAIPGVNTLLLTFDNSPVGDMIAIGVTPSNDGYARTGGPAGTGVFAISTTNVGATSTLIARPRFSNGSIPMNATVCETDSAAACKAPAAGSVSRSFAKNEAATFTVFVKANGAQPVDPANARLFLEFLDTGGIVRGSTSTAVTTQ